MQHMNEYRRRQTQLQQIIKRTAKKILLNQTYETQQKSKQKSKRMILKSRNIKRGCKACVLSTSFSRRV